MFPLIIRDRDVNDDKWFKLTDVLDWMNVCRPTPLIPSIWNISTICVHP